MRARGNKKTKVNIVTLGCSKNLVDSEVLLTQLRANDIDATHESTTDDSRVVVIITCGFIDNAKQESIDTILRYVDAKNEGLVEKVYVTGCLSQRYKDDLQREIPQVDAWFGTRDLSRLLKQFNADYKKELVGERILTNPGHYAYLKISEGCDRPCSFCAIGLPADKLRRIYPGVLVVKPDAAAVVADRWRLLYAGDLDQAVAERLIEVGHALPTLGWRMTIACRPKGPEDAQARAHLQAMLRPQLADGTVTLLAEVDDMDALLRKAALQIFIADHVRRKVDVPGAARGAGARGPGAEPGRDAGVGDLRGGAGARGRGGGGGRRHRRAARGAPRGDAVAAAVVDGSGEVAREFSLQTMAAQYAALYDELEAKRASER